MFSLTGCIYRLIRLSMLTVKQFADKIGLSRQRIHQLMREGRISPAPKRVGCYFLVSPKAKLKRA
jgi:predicted DNA-binding transcriptional regulator AlpA